MGTLGWAVAFLLLGLLVLLASAAYNILLHPLRHVPGPFFARESGLPSWYHAYRGDRHIWHVKRWPQLLVEGSGTEWSAPIDLSESLDTLSFDIMGGLSFGKSFDVKERGKNSFKSIPYNIMQYLRFYYPIARSPFLKLLILLKPRGFNNS
ncbi:hypothetical protein PG995_013636 [Apiospora arundinis]